MATPIAHKGATAGAKVMAMTILDFLMRPELVTGAWDYFRNVQTKGIKYQPLIRPYLPFASARGKLHIQTPEELPKRRRADVA